ncbi:MAG: ATP-binding protein, partial [Muribaculaceae bacterium]|nr:ATP-binding protein [Muribaculaceae bacterium]
VECDFVVQQDEHIEKLIQVCWTLADSKTLQREIRGLKTASDLTGCKDCSIITFDESDELVSDGIEIKVLPIWKWLLTSPFE